MWLCGFRRSKRQARLSLGEDAQHHLNIGNDAHGHPLLCKEASIATPPDRIPLLGGLPATTVAAQGGEGAIDQQPKHDAGTSPGFGSGSGPALDAAGHAVLRTVLNQLCYPVTLIDYDGNVVLQNDASRWLWGDYLAAASCAGARLEAAGASVPSGTLSSATCLGLTSPLQLMFFTDKDAYVEALGRIEESRLWRGLLQMPPANELLLPMFGAAMASNPSMPTAYLGSWTAAASQAATGQGPGSIAAAGAAALPQHPPTAIATIATALPPPASALAAASASIAGFGTAAAAAAATTAAATSGVVLDHPPNMQAEDAHLPTEEAMLLSLSTGADMAGLAGQDGLPRPGRAASRTSRATRASGTYGGQGHSREAPELETLGLTCSDVDACLDTGANPLASHADATEAVAAAHRQSGVQALDASSEAGNAVFQGRRPRGHPNGQPSRVSSRVDLALASGGSAAAAGGAEAPSSRSLPPPPPPLADADAADAVPSDVGCNSWGSLGPLPSNSSCSALRPAGRDLSASGLQALPAPHPQQPSFPQPSSSTVQQEGQQEQKHQQYQQQRQSLEQGSAKGEARRNRSLPRRAASVVLPVPTGKQPKAGSVNTIMGWVEPPEQHSPRAYSQMHPSAPRSYDCSTACMSTAAPHGFGMSSAFPTVAVAASSGAGLRQPSRGLAMPLASLPAPRSLMLPSAGGIDPVSGSAAWRPAALPGYPHGPCSPQLVPSPQAHQMKMAEGLTTSALGTLVRGRRPGSVRRYVSTTALCPPSAVQRARELLGSAGWAPESGNFASSLPIAEHGGVPEGCISVPPRDAMPASMSGTNHQQEQQPRRLAPLQEHQQQQREQGQAWVPRSSVRAGSATGGVGLVQMGYVPGFRSVDGPDLVSSTGAGAVAAAAAAAGGGGGGAGEAGPMLLSFDSIIQSSALLVSDHHGTPRATPAGTGAAVASMDLNGAGTGAGGAAGPRSTEAQSSLPSGPEVNLGILEEDPCAHPTTTTTSGGVYLVRDASAAANVSGSYHRLSSRKHLPSSSNSRLQRLAAPGQIDSSVASSGGSRVDSTQMSGLAVPGYGAAAVGGSGGHNSRPTSAMHRLLNMAFAVASGSGSGTIQQPQPGYCASSHHTSYIEGAAGLVPTAAAAAGSGVPGSSQELALNSAMGFAGLQPPSSSDRERVKSVVLLGVDRLGDSSAAAGVPPPAAAPEYMDMDVPGSRTPHSYLASASSSEPSGGAGSPTVLTLPGPPPSAAQQETAVLFRGLDGAPAPAAAHRSGSGPDEEAAWRLAERFAVARVSRSSRSASKGRHSGEEVGSLYPDRSSGPFRYSGNFQAAVAATAAAAAAASASAGRTAMSVWSIGSGGSGGGGNVQPGDRAPPLLRVAQLGQQRPAGSEITFADNPARFSVSGLEGMSDSQAGPVLMQSCGSSRHSRSTAAAAAAALLNSGTRSSTAAAAAPPEMRPTASTVIHGGSGGGGVAAPAARPSLAAAVNAGSGAAGGDVNDSSGGGEPHLCTIPSEEPWKEAPPMPAAAHARWHEVTLTRFVHPTLRRPVIMMVQNDVSTRIWAERQVARVMEAEHALLENIFPNHVLQHIAATAAAAAEAEDTPLGPPATSPGATGTNAGVKRPSLPGGLPTAAAVAAAAAACGSQSRAPPPPLGPAGFPAVGPPAVHITGDTFLHLATSHSALTVLFCDIQGFTTMCNQVKPGTVMAFLNDLYTRLDAMLDVFGVYKVETIGDCYVAAGGLMKVDEETGAVTVRSDDVDPQHAHRTVQFAKALLRAAAGVRLPTTGEPVRLRVGIHSGPAMSGVVGTRMPRFCLFGDTINTASRMESTGVPGAIHVSKPTRDLVPEEDWEPTGGVEAKGKGLMETFLLKPPEQPIP